MSAGSNGRRSRVTSLAGDSAACRIARVDVSLDGGRNWREAAIDGLRLDKAVSRFYAETEWSGGEMLLQSRAIDETGYVQPTKDTLIASRGVWPLFLAKTNW
jgi:sulfane dehydrogenase subunit SoxC